MTTYYEMHVTFTGPLEKIALFQDMIELNKWRYSSIEGDANLGDGVKRYATRQMNARIPVHEVIQILSDMAAHLERNGAVILRRKVEKVIYDDRSSLVKPCDGKECPTCPSNIL